MTQQLVLETKKKLSDYIRSAIGKYQQIRGHYYDAADITSNKRCVVGAIMSEMGWTPGTQHRKYTDEITRIFPIGVLIHLNDDVGYSFQQCLDRLEGENL